MEHEHIGQKQAAIKLKIWNCTVQSLKIVILWWQSISNN